MDTGLVMMTLDAIIEAGVTSALLHNCGFYWVSLLDVGFP